MTLQSAIEAELPFLRSEAEALMVEQFQVGDYGDGWTYDPATETDVREFDVDFTSSGRVLTTTGPSESEVGERSVVSIGRTLHLPVATPPVTAGKVARRVSDGADFRILAEITHPQPKSRRFAVEEVLS